MYSTSSAQHSTAAPPVLPPLPSRKTGYGTYFSLPGKTHGARVIQLKLGESAAHSETWIRNERGEREDQVGSTPGDTLGVGSSIRYVLLRAQVMASTCLTAGAACLVFAMQSRSLLDASQCAAKLGRPPLLPPCRRPPLLPRRRLCRGSSASACMMK